MTPRALLLAAVGLTAAIGCRRDPYMTKYVESLHGDIRMLEDYAYQLEYKNSVLADELAIMREKAGEADDDPLKPARSPSTKGRSSIGPSRSPLSLEPPQRRIPAEPAPRDGRTDLPGSFDLSPPVIEPGTPEPPDVDVPQTEPDQMRSRSQPQSLATSTENGRQPPTAEIIAEGIPDPPPEPIRDFRVAHLVINPYLTSGRDQDQQPGDDGLMVVVAPRNAADQYLMVPGQVSVALIDPDLSGDASRVARWDFDVDEVREAMQPGERQRGIHLWLPWPDAPPKHERLQLYVRYIDSDGRKLQSDQEIFVTLPGQYSQRWTPRSGSQL